MKKKHLIASFFLAVLAAPVFFSHTALAMASATRAATTTFAQATPPAEEEKSCEDGDPENSWFLCPALRILDKFVDFLDRQINSLLKVPNEYFEGSGGANKLKDSWSRMRNLAYIILVPILLVMVIGTALGFDFVSAYTVKRALPRFIAALFFIALSYEVSTFLIKLTNDVGSGMLGLITSGLGGEDKGLADMFDPKGGSGAIFTGILAGGAILAPGAIMIILSYAFVIGLALLVGFLALALRQVILIGLVLLGPLAILAWIFPGNDKLWKLWWGSFSKLLLLYPLITILIGAGRVFADVADYKPGSGLLETILILSAYIGPYFFIPAMFKFAGGLFGTIAGMANDKSRGLFDRQKKYRQGKIGERYRDFKAGDYYHRGNPIARAVNRSGEGVGAGWKGRYGVGGRGRQSRARNSEVAAADATKNNPHLQNLAQNSDEGAAVLAFSGGTARGGRQAADELRAQWTAGPYRQERIAHHLRQGLTQQQAELQADADIEDRTQRAYDAAAAVGFTNQNAQAMLGLVAQNKSRAVDPSNYDMVRNGINRLAGNNVERAADLNDSFQYFSRQAGRFDLGGTGPGGGVNRAGVYQIANAHPSTVTGSADSYAATFNDPNATDAQRMEAARFFTDLRQALPNSTGETRDAIVQVLNNQQYTQDVQAFLQAPGQNMVTTQVPVMGEVTRPHPTIQNATITVREQLRDAQGNPRFTQQQITEREDQVRRYARVLQRDDPEILQQQQNQGGPSDIRLKRDVVFLQTHSSGIKLYRFRYVWSDQEYVGVMAQDLLQSHPDAIYMDQNGFYGVDYGLLGLEMVTYEEWLAAQGSARHLARV